MRKYRNKNQKVVITSGDRELVQIKYPEASQLTIDRRATARAAAREVLLETKSTAEALDSLTLGIPEATLHSWMKGRLKMAV